MIRILAPEVYDRSPDVLGTIATHVAALGGRAFVLGGETALGLALPQIAASLESRGLPWETRLFRGQPTAAVIDDLAAEIATRDGVVVVGVGGGKALDAAKAAGVKAGRPIVTVPTVPATCAAWAALSIVYSAEGVQEEIRWLPYGPARVLVDPAILAAAPRRFLAAGIADTVVKWWETLPNLAGRGDPLALRLQAAIARFTLDTIDQALAETDGGRTITAHPIAHADLLDAIVGLAGLCGSIKGEVVWGGFAHPFYGAATREPVTRRFLHGEIVGFGHLVQWALEGRRESEIAASIEMFRGLDLPVTLAAIGIDDDATIDRIAAHIAASITRGPFVDRADPARIAAAIRAVDGLGRRSPATES
ncbi:iron-containing alcohol dehydrogenase [Siculibacillus lacustris]|uniref:Iron-containing alcohol dehydrogenase n=1 Tax=Siculibacillus lacustris TaxID=1549641 RepID=A0A4Q9VUW2_9HYPH|nr:iron-containing alcohol dehydrogenase [Siculibacillus lacustris]TBW39486.1 iron-containing alcohol dehydrogenase [Siculibacillus lacustris]